MSAAALAGYLNIILASVTVMGLVVHRRTSLCWAFFTYLWAVLTCVFLTGAWWAWAAWRPVRVPDPIIGKLQPWAHSW